mmetsp:Transcript_18900/g.43824  ORF Transcript_18900/g.43824 Transcript_18900/m.43824 type:complete len:281 (-) Transcript_18900:333-1175(-)
MAHREHRKPLVLASSLVAGGGANDSATEQVPTTPVASLHRNHWLCIQLEIRTYPLFSLLVLYGADEASVIRTTSHPFQLGERVRSPAMSHRTRASTLGLWRKHSSPVTHWSSHTYVIIDGTGAPAAQRIGLPRSVMPRRSPVFFATRVTPPLGWSAPLHGTMDHSRSSRSAVAAASTGRSSSSSSPSSSSSSETMTPPTVAKDNNNNNPDDYFHSNPSDAGRLTNHSSDPNTGPDGALRDILPGEELTMDYSFHGDPAWYRAICARYGVRTEAQIAADAV